MTLNLLVIESGKQKVRPSNAQTADFIGINIGAGLLPITEASGKFDFGGKVLSNVASPTTSGEALIYDQLGANNGIATLDSGGKIPAAQLPNSVMEFKGQWDASTNTPSLANGTGNAGDVWRANVAGSVDFGAGSISFVVGDWVMYNGTIWEKANNGDSVTSVNGQMGVVSLTTSDIPEGSNLYFTQGAFDTAFASKTTTDLAEGSNLYFTDTRAKAAAVANSINSGTLDVAPSQDAVYQALGLKQDTMTASNGVKISGVDIQRDDSRPFTNDNAGSITQRQVVYIKSNGHVDLALANVAALPDSMIGLVEDATVATTASGNVTLRNGAIVGGFTGLTPGKKQYVDRTTAGALTEDLTGFTTGDSVYSIGRAISATEILVNPSFEFQY